METIGFAVVGIGLVLWTIGVFISFGRTYQIWNEMLLNISRFSLWAYLINSLRLTWATFRDPKGGWWSTSGLVMFLAGMGLMFLSQSP